MTITTTALTAADIKPGMKVRVLRDTSSHKFDIGTVATVVNAHEFHEDDFLVTTDPEVTEWQSYFGKPEAEPFKCRYVSLRDIEVVREFGIGDLVRLKSNSNSTHFKVGDVFTLVGHETDSSDYFLGSSDITVREWNYRECSNVFADDLELVESAADRTPQIGDTVLILPAEEGRKYHMEARGKVGTYVRDGGGLTMPYGYVTLEDGTTRTWGGDEFDLFHKDLRVLIPVPVETVPVTESDILALSKAFHEAEATHAYNEVSVDNYTEWLKDAEASLAEAATKREEAYAALQDALVRFKG